MVEITREMKEERNRKIAAIEKRVDDRINRAIANGQNSCLFECYRDSINDGPFYTEVRKKYEDAGYFIKPTGYICGVWQLTEDICW